MKIRVNKVRRLYWIGLIFIGVMMISSWGFLVHRTINQLAIYELPKPMQPFFYTHMDSIVLNAPRPDIRRNTDSTEGSKHFIDFEFFGDSAQYKMPRDIETATNVFGIKKLKAWGTLPYEIIATQNKLTQAFKNKNTDSIIFYATDLGHYIGDAHVPLHTSSNYDGQLTNQAGMHDLWETSVPELLLKSFRLASKRKAQYLNNPTDRIWKVLQESHALLPEMLAIEKEISKNYTDSTKKYQWIERWGKIRRFYSKDFTLDYGKQLQPSINHQLIQAAHCMADFWYTAWVNAGKPDLSKLNSKYFSKKDFKKEQKAFHKNQLIQKNILISVQQKKD